MAYKDPNYMVKWRAANPEKCRSYTLRHYHRKDRFARAGVTSVWYQQQLERQDHRCAICGNRVANLHIDHNHVTGEVRGLLCLHCNTGLGHFKESDQLMINAMKYLAEHRDTNRV